MKNKKIIIRKVLKKDFSLLAEYLSKEALPKYSSSQYSRRFKFWWLENPAFKKNDSYGWIIFDDNKKKKIKGFLGNIPADYKINNKIYHTVSASTWVVNPKYRRYSIYLYFSFLKQKKDLFLNSTPANITNYIFTKTNFIDNAKSQNNFVYLVSDRPIYYLFKKLLKSDYISIVLSKLTFLFYQFLFIIKSDIKKLNIKYQIVSNLVEIEKLLKNKRVKLMNFDWVIKADPNKHFIKILNRNKSNNFIYIQYVDNPVNKLKFVQVLETDIVCADLIKKIVFKIALKYNYCLDYIIIHNKKLRSLLFGSFIKFNILSESKCLIKSDKFNVKNIVPNGTFGEKGFIIWN